MKRDDQLVLERAKVFGEIEGGSFERISPGHFPEAVVREHEARYRWAARYVRDESVLDVGCGTAYGCDILANSGARYVTGIDIALPALQHGKTRFAATLVCGEISSLPFRSCAFDVVTCFEVIEHVREQESLLREMKRVLKPGGILLVSTPNKMRSSGTNPYHLKELRVSEFISLISDSGLKVQKMLGQHWRVGPSLLRRMLGIRTVIYAIDNASTILRLPAALGEPSVYVAMARK
jgi:2-polyprenyl-3-methyl-5-hydroxy-6-metoxy-1,4-benzoquinol methylase